GGIEGPAALEEVTDARAGTGRRELRLDLVEEAMRGAEFLAQRMRARDLREDLQALVAARRFERAAESALARGGIGVFPEGFDVAVVAKHRSGCHLRNIGRGVTVCRGVHRSTE